MADLSGGDPGLAPGDANRMVVTSAELVRQFAKVRQSAGEQPIHVTHHGRDTNVVVTAPYFAALVEGFHSVGQDGALGDQLPTINELIGWLSCAVLTIDPQMRVLVANQAAFAMIGRDAKDLLGQSIYDAIPQLQGSLVQTYINHAVATKERCAADLPSIFQMDSWMKLDVYPQAGCTTILFHDITDDIRRNRMADTKQAILDAITLHGTIGYLRLNTRGHIDRVDDTICSMLQLADTRLMQVALIDLVPTSCRVPFREALNAVLSGEGSRRVETTLLANNGAAIPVVMSIAELRGVYGNEGAVLIITQR